MAKYPFKLWKRGKTWYYCTALDPHWRTTGKRMKAEALKLAKEHAPQDRPREREKHATTTFAEYAAPYFTESCPYLIPKQDEEGRTFGAFYIACCRRYLTEKILPDPISSIPIQQIVYDDVIAFRHRLVVAYGGKRNATNKAFSVFKLIMHDAMVRGHITANPAAGTHNIREQRVRPGVFTRTELRTLFPETGVGPWKDVRSHAAFVLAMQTGMRPSEILAVQWRQVDLDAATIVVDRAFKANSSTIGPPKSNSPRNFRLPGKCVDALRSVRDGSIRLAPVDLVFCDDLGRQYGRTWWRRRFASALEASGFTIADRHLRPYSLRHTFITLAKEAGVNPAKLGAAVGHSDARTTANYTHLDASHLGEIKDFADSLLDNAKQ